jgi:hypothetical protein
LKKHQDFGEIVASHDLETPERAKFAPAPASPRPKEGTFDQIGRKESNFATQSQPTTSLVCLVIEES